MRNITSIIILLIAILLTFSCSQKEQDTQHKEAATLDTTSVITPFTANSNGSKTYISSTTICAAEVPKDANTQTCGWGGSGISFYAIGKNFVALDEKSLKISVLEVNGIDILLDRKKEKNYDLGSFPTASDNGQYVKWGVNIKSGYHRTEDELKIKGSIDVYSSDKLLEEKSGLFKLNDFSTFTIGPVKVKGTKASKEDMSDFFAEDDEVSSEDIEILKKLSKIESTLGKDATKEEAMKHLTEMGLSKVKIESLMEKLIAYMFQEAFSGFGMSDKETARIEILGDSSTIDRVELYADGKKLGSNGWSGWNESKTYNFEKPESGQVELKIFFWNKPEKVNLKFDF